VYVEEIGTFPDAARLRTDGDLGSARGVKVGFRRPVIRESWHAWVKARYIDPRRKAGSHQQIQTRVYSVSISPHGSLIIAF